VRAQNLLDTARTPAPQTHADQVNTALLDFLRT